MNYISFWVMRDNSRNISIDANYEEVMFITNFKDKKLPKGDYYALISSKGIVLIDKIYKDGGSKTIYYNKENRV